MRKKTTSKKNHKNIASADVVVSELPGDFLAEAGLTNQGRLFGVRINGEFLRTPAENLIFHKDIRTMRELAAEIDYSDELDETKISLYNLCCTQIDFVQHNRQEFSEEFLTQVLLNDPVYKPCAGPEIIEQMKYLVVVVDFLKEKSIRYPNLPQIPLDNEWLSESEADDFKNNFRRLVVFISNSVEQLNDYERTVFITVSHVYKSPTLGLMLARKMISPNEFAIVYYTSLAVNSKIWGDTNRKQEQKYLENCTKQTECMRRYIDQFSEKLTDAEKIIQAGESISVEFKSTLRWNIKENRQDSKMEHAVLKTIVAFLNSEGGNLLVGVEDNGNVLGIELDGFLNEDKYLLHFTNLVNTKIGKQFSEFIKHDLKPAWGKKILSVQCRKCPRPAVLKVDGKEEFYIRTGPSSVQLSPSEMLEYSKTRFSYQ